MKLRSEYDWVVFGDHPGAILGGAMAARLGQSVILVPAKRPPTVRRSATGKVLDQESNYLLGLTGSGKSAGVAAECTRFLLSGNPKWPLPQGSPIELCSTQIATPRARISLRNEGHSLGAELSRELGGGGVAGAAPLEEDWKAVSQASDIVEALVHLHWRKLPERLISGRSRREHVSRMVAKHRLEQKISRRLTQDASREVSGWGGDARELDLVFAGTRPNKEALDAMWHALCASGRGSGYSPVSLLHMLVLSNTGARVRGGRSAYRVFLLELAHAWGAQVLAAAPGMDCRAMFVEDGELRGIQLSTQGKMISTGGVLLGCSLGEAQRRQSSTGKAPEWKTPPIPGGWVFSIALAVDAWGIPPGMGSRLAWNEEGAAPVEIEVASGEEYRLVEKGIRLVHLRTVLPFLDETLKSGYLRLVAARMMRLFMDLAPFAIQHLKWVYPDFRSGLDEVSEAYPYSAVRDLPDFLHADFGEGLGVESGVENLFLANDEAYPALGTMGAMASALEALAYRNSKTG